MRKYMSFTIMITALFGSTLGACDEAIHEELSGIDDEQTQADDSLTELVESGLTLTEFADGRRRFRANSIAGVRALLLLVDAGEVDMDTSTRKHLQAHVEPQSDGGTDRAYGPCATPLGSGTVQTQRKWLWVWSGYEVSATAQWTVPGFGPKPSVRAEVLVCVGIDCKVETAISVGPNLHVSRLVALGQPAVLAAAKIENTMGTCYYASQLSSGSSPPFGWC